MIIFCDGGSRGNPGPAASAFIVYKDDKLVHKQSAYIGETTNNVAEYTALLMAVKWLKDNPADVEIILDSELVKKQMTGEYKIKNENLRKLASEIRGITNTFSVNISFAHTLRKGNSEADNLVNMELDKQN